MSQRMSKAMLDQQWFRCEKLVRIKTLHWKRWVQCCRRKLQPVIVFDTTPAPFVSQPWTSMPMLTSLWSQSIQSPESLLFASWAHITFTSSLPAPLLMSYAESSLLQPAGLYDSQEHCMSMAGKFWGYKAALQPLLNLFSHSNNRQLSVASGIDTAVIALSTVKCPLHGRKY